MDAFPDYTRFDRTHKVLAAIQVINDVTGEDEGTREKCVSNDSSKAVELSQTGADSEKQAFFTFDNESTATNVAITMNGNTVDGTHYDTTIFETHKNKGARGVEVRIELDDILEDKKDYVIIQDNPGLEYVSDEEEVKALRNAYRFEKTKSYKLTDFDEKNYQILVTDKPGPISVKVCEKTSAGALVVLRTVDITNRMSFTEDKPGD